MIKYFNHIDLGERVPKKTGRKKPRIVQRMNYQTLNNLHGPSKVPVLAKTSMFLFASVSLDLLLRGVFPFLSGECLVSFVLLNADTDHAA